jgi:GxxExxY protein
LLWPDFVALITNPTAGAVIDCALRVHRTVGPGLFESVYEQCLAYEMEDAGLSYRRQVRLPLSYGRVRFQKAFQADFIVEECVLVELKAVSFLTSVHRAQTLTYLRLSGVKKGLLINFNSARLKDGIVSVVI